MHLQARDDKGGLQYPQKQRSGMAGRVPQLTQATGRLHRPARSVWLFVHLAQTSRLLLHDLPEQAVGCPQPCECSQWFLP